MKRLYISGANPNAGIWLNDFEKKFGNADGNMRSLLKCCIQFGALADTTFQNALETRCWVQSQGLTGPILLITSTRHMARARAALGHLLPMVEITPYPVPEEEDRVNTSERLRQRTIDYMKYLATVALMELPSSVIPPAIYGRFYNGCPAIAKNPRKFPAGVSQPKQKGTPICAGPPGGPALAVIRVLTCFFPSHANLKFAAYGSPPASSHHQDRQPSPKQPNRRAAAWAYQVTQVLKAVA